MPVSRIQAVIVLALLIPVGTALAQSAVPVSAPQSAFDLVLKEGQRVAQQGKYYDAALLFNKILTEGEESKPYYQEAQFELGRALFELGFPVSAFNYFDRVADFGQDHVRFRDTLSYLAKIHRKLPGETNTLFRMSSYPVEMYPEDMAEEISLYVGQYHYYQGNLDLALEALARVGASEPEQFVKAMYLKGVVFVRKNEAVPASEAFKEVLRFVNENEIDGGARYQEMAQMAMARVFYSIGQFDTEAYKTAVKYYDQIPDTSELWLDSLFEKSWAYYQTGNFSRALGNLLTVNSPFFEEEYYPEAHVVRAVIFFKNCLYEEALATVDPFYKEYYDIMKELKTVLERYEDPARFYGYLASLATRGSSYSLKVKKIFNAALTDKKLRRLFGFVIDINNEIQQIEELRKHPVAQKMADFLLPDLHAYRSLTIAEAGQLARERLARVNTELRKLLSQALKVRFESLNAQKGVLDEKFRQEQVSDAGGAVVASEVEIAVDPEHRFWPFDGEYWKDELGSYYYPVRSICGAK